jgi:hypothetical protein
MPALRFSSLLVERSDRATTADIFLGVVRWLWWSRRAEGHPARAANGEADRAPSEITSLVLGMRDVLGNLDAGPVRDPLHLRLVPSLSGPRSVIEPVEFICNGLE